MSRAPKKPSGTKRGKAFKLNLAVLILSLVVVIQAFLLWRAHAPSSEQPASKKKPGILTQKTQPASAPQTKTSKPHDMPAPHQPGTAKGKIVIIIDDSGYKRKDCEHLAEIKVPVTISILPELPYSREIAQCAHAQGKEVMLHLPLEPHVFHEKYPSHYFIKTNMSSAQITNRFTEALRSVPHVVGINNHEGSKATEDARIMYIIFKEVAKRNLFFLDSKVTSKSVCGRLAEKLGLPFAARDVFLDNKSDRDYIRGQFRELAQKASTRGSAIAIGHARDLSWEVMKEQIRELSAQGYEFTTVQNLINSRK